MLNYDSMRQRYSKPVCQTVDAPIQVFDYFELAEVFVALVALLIFGIVIYSWELMLLSLTLTLGVLPVVRKRHPKGFFLHLPYKHLGMQLPGLINPKGNKKYSD